MKDFDLKKYLAENKLLKEEVDVNKILSDGGYDIIDDEELLMTVKNHPEFNSNIDAEKLNFLVMKIEDEEGGNIDFSEGKILKETKEMAYYYLLMDLGGTELAGDTFQDMMKKRNDFNSFEDFLDDELDFFQEEGDVEIINKIKSYFSKT